MSFLVKHLVDDEGVKRATLYAGAPDRKPYGRFIVGWAACNEGDVFSKKAGVTLARDRAKVYSEQGRRPRFLPPVILEALPDFLARCRKYFQGKDLPGWCQIAPPG